MKEMAQNVSDAQFFLDRTDVERAYTRFSVKNERSNSKLISEKLDLFTAIK